MRYTPSPKSRLEHCKDKTQALLEACQENGVLYSYATFGSRSTQWGQISSNDLSKALSGNEGTSLKTLSEAAIDAAKDVLNKTSTSVRMVFVMNTDGEATDGQQASSHFQTRYKNLCKEHEIESTRSFVLGIGGQHDQKVLAGVSVGVPTYYNYPDSELHTMVADSVAQIVPELSGQKEQVKLTIISTDMSTGSEIQRIVSATAENGSIDLSQIRLEANEFVGAAAGMLHGTHRIRLPSGIEVRGQEQLVEPETPLYFQLQLRSIQVIVPVRSTHLVSCLQNIV
jgi:hypothetical protein